MENICFFRPTALAPAPLVTQSLHGKAPHPRPILLPSFVAFLRLKGQQRRGAAARRGEATAGRGTIFDPCSPLARRGGRRRREEQGVPPSGGTVRYENITVIWHNRDERSKKNEISGPRAALPDTCKGSPKEMYHKVPFFGRSRSSPDNRSSPAPSFHQRGARVVASGEHATEVVSCGMKCRLHLFGGRSTHAASGLLADSFC